MSDPRIPSDDRPSRLDSMEPSMDPNATVSSSTSPKISNNINDINNSSTNHNLSFDPPQEPYPVLGHESSSALPTSQNPSSTLPSQGPSPSVPSQHSRSVPGQDSPNLPQSMSDETITSKKTPGIESTASSDLAKSSNLTNTDYPSTDTIAPSALRNQPMVSRSSQLPDRLRSENDSADEEDLVPTTQAQTLLLNQSIFGLIAAAGSRNRSFEAYDQHFSEDESEEEDEDQEDAGLSLPPQEPGSLVLSQKKGHRKQKSDHLRHPRQLMQSLHRHVARFHPHHHRHPSSEAYDADDNEQDTHVDQPKKHRLLHSLPHLARHVKAKTVGDHESGQSKTEESTENLGPPRTPLSPTMNTDKRRPSESTLSETNTATTSPSVSPQSTPHSPSPRAVHTPSRDTATAHPHLASPRSPRFLSPPLPARPRRSTSVDSSVTTASPASSQGALSPHFLGPRPRHSPKHTQGYMFDGEDEGGEEDGRSSSHLAKNLKNIFEFDEVEEVYGEYPCWLLQSVLLQGNVYVTARHICFYAYLPKKAHEVSKSGYLSKTGKRNPKYNRFWFRLKGDVLAYYQDPANLYFPHGQIDLRYALSANAVDKDRDKTGQLFTIELPQRTYHFRADSAPSAREWIKSLQRVIFRSRNDGDSVKISLPMSNILDIEDSPMLDFAKTCKIRVIDNDETYAIDEYFFSFFSQGREAIELMKLFCAADTRPAAAAIEGGDAQHTSDYHTALADRIHEAFDHTEPDKGPVEDQKVGNSVESQEKDDVLSQPDRSGGSKWRIARKPLKLLVSSQPGEQDERQQVLTETMASAENPPVLPEPVKATLAVSPTSTGPPHPTNSSSARSSMDYPSRSSTDTTRAFSLHYHNSLPRSSTSPSSRQNRHEREVSSPPRRSFSGSRPGGPSRTSSTTQHLHPLVYQSPLHDSIEEVHHETSFGSRQSSPSPSPSPRPRPNHSQSQSHHRSHTHSREESSDSFVQCSDDAGPSSVSVLSASENFSTTLDHSRDEDDDDLFRPSIHPSDVNRRRELGSPTGSSRGSHCHSNRLYSAPGSQRQTQSLLPPTSLPTIPQSHEPPSTTNHTEDQTRHSLEDRTDDDQTENQLQAVHFTTDPSQNPTDDQQRRRAEASAVAVASSASLQQIAKIGAGSLRKAGTLAVYLNETTRKMSNMLATESMGYVEKVHGMWKGGRKHYYGHASEEEYRKAVLAGGGPGLDEKAVAEETRMDPATLEEMEVSQERFRMHFALPESERLQATFFGYIIRVLPLYGKIYISDRSLCFRSLLPGTRTKLILPLRDIETVHKEKGFRFGFSGLVVVIRAHEELFFEFNQSDIRDDCTITLLRTMETTTKNLPDMDMLPTDDKRQAEVALAERDALQQFRRQAPETETKPVVPSSPNRSEDSSHGHHHHHHHRHLRPKDEKNQIRVTVHQDRDYDLDEKAAQEASLTDDGPPILFDDARASILQFKPTEPMRITCLTIGSRGDVQPYIALCKGLKADGHHVRIATHAEFQSWVEGHGIEFSKVEGDPAELMRLCIENGTFTWSFLKEANATFRGWLDDLLASAWVACQGSDLLIESPSAMAGIHIAEALQIPYFRAFTMPWTRTRAYPHAFIVPEYKMGGAYNYMTYVMFDNIFWKAMAYQVNQWRNKTLHLPSTNLERLQVNKIPFLYNFSPSVVPPPLDFSDWIRVTGYWFLDEGADQWTPPPDMVAFIEKARRDRKKLVYVGFGSILVNDPAKMTQEVIDAVLKSDVRCILSKGWSERPGKTSTSTSATVAAAILHPISSNTNNDNNATSAPKPEPKMPPEIFVITSAPHDWLFKHIDAAAHHGGSGTTGASLRAGIPTIIRPFFGDQFFFGSRVEDTGVGICLKKWGANSFGRALWEATHNERMIQKAKTLGEKIRAEDGVATAIQCIYRDLEYAKSLIKRNHARRGRAPWALPMGGTGDTVGTETETETGVGTEGRGGMTGTGKRIMDAWKPHGDARLGQREDSAKTITFHREGAAASEADDKSPDDGDGHERRYDSSPGESDEEESWTFVSVEEPRSTDRSQRRQQRHSPLVSRVAEAEDAEADDDAERARTHKFPYPDAP